MTSQVTNTTQTSAAELNDTQLETIAGAVNGGMVLASIFTFGIACAAVSIIAEGNKKDGCSDAFNH